MGTVIHPLGALIIVAAAAGVVALVCAAHAYFRRAARKELEDYKAKVVALSDKIDALKERHKLLPYMDKDFAVPMAGETLAAYNAAADQLARHRGEWLKLMDAWEEAQALVQSQWLLGSRRARQARRRIKAAEVAAEATALERECQAPLDRLEQAHEQVAAKATAFEQDKGQFETNQQTLRDTSLSTDAYQADWTAAQTLIEQAKAAVAADPLAALRMLDEGLGKLTQLNQKAVKILDHARSAKGAAQQIEQAAQLAGQRRSQGFLLHEAEADPDPLVANARQHVATCWERMNQADESAAGTALATAVALATQAQKAIEEHVAARATCQSEIPLRQSENCRLAEMQVAARNQRMELENDFAPEAWVSVAENASHAQGYLASAGQLTDQAAQHAAANVQNYLQAKRLLSQAAKSQQQAEQALTAIGERLRELVKLRGACQSQLNDVLGHADGVARLLRSSTADRVQANERFRSASSRLQRLAEESRLPRPDWTQLAARLGEVEADLRRAEKLAREDVRLAEQAAAEIAETENVMAQARGFHELGFRPDISAADVQLSQARLRLAAQEYEEAIRLANAAEQATRDAWNHAKMRARQRQAENESQQHAAEAARAANFSAQMPALPAEAEEPVARQSQMI